MSGRSKFFLTLLMLFILFLCFEVYLYYHRSDSQRERNLLMDQYYKLRNVDHDAAIRALNLLYKQNPQDQQALRELSYWYLREGDTNNALKYFQLAVQNDPTDLESAFELAKLYMLIDDPAKALPLLKLAATAKDLALQDRARGLLQQIPDIAPRKMETGYTPANSPLLLVDFLKHAYAYTPISTAGPETTASVTTVAASISKTAVGAAAGTMTERDKLLNEFYQNKVKNPTVAWSAIEKLLEMNPKDLVALKEAGYFALSEKRNEVAFDYLRRAYEISHEPMLAMQVGYILDGLGRRREAYNYFDLATNNPKLDERYKAEIALTNLRGVQTKFLPDPLFIDVFYNPIHFTRFDLLVHPIISRFGMTLSQKYQWQLYFSYRRTFDNRSGLAGSLPQIYQDSTSIFALGTQIRPFTNIPMVAFFEAGKARNLVPGVEPHWRGDLRGGLAYYNEWGHEAQFTFHPTFPFKFIADVYGDAIYYSRYQNWIGTVRFRPGLEIFSYLASSIDLYFRGFVIEDTQRQFYNNLTEYGLGVAFIPSNRYNIAFRYEFTQGHYLPSGSPDPNPYGPNYHNNVIECDFFFRF